MSPLPSAAQRNSATPRPRTGASKATGMGQRSGGRATASASMTQANPGSRYHGTSAARASPARSAEP